MSRLEWLSSSLFYSLSNLFVHAGFFPSFCPNFIHPHNPSHMSILLPLLFLFPGIQLASSQGYHSCK